MVNKQAIRDAYGEALLALGGQNQDVVVLESDVGHSDKSILFGKAYPERYFNVGISEGNMAAMAAGFASAGKIPFINTFAVFMALRAGDPINSLIAHNHLNVKLAGTFSGLSAAYDGASHHALSDIAVMRSMPNMAVVSIADAVEAKKAVKAAAAYSGPVYLRISRAALPIIFSAGDPFSIGMGMQLTEGQDATILATGYMVYKALLAAENLKNIGISARVVNIHTIKPIDRELIIRCAKETGAIVTAEEHNVIGGLGSAAAEVLVKECPVPMDFVGVEDRFTESGEYEQLLEKYGLNVANIMSKVQKVLMRKKASDCH